MTTMHLGDHQIDGEEKHLIAVASRLDRGHLITANHNDNNTVQIYDGT